MEDKLDGISEASLRFIEKFIENGCLLDGFSRAEILSFILESADDAPPVDPDAAYKLLYRFGSLKGVLSAAEGELDGGEWESLFDMGLLLRSANDPRKMLPLALDDGDSLTAFFSSLFCGAENETLYLLALDSGERITDYKRISGGKSRTADADIRLITSAADGFYGCKSFALAHNHSGGGPASAEDISSTSAIASRLSEQSRSLISHFVYGDGRVQRTPVKYYNSEHELMMTVY